MPTIPQISNPISGKSYSQNNLAGKQASVGGEQFDIIKLINPLETVSVSDRDAGKKGALLEQKDFLPMLVKLNKDPTMAVESLKLILNSDLLAVAKANGYTELYGELDALMKSVFISPEGIVSELIAQEQNTTLFGNDKFYELLRQLVGASEGKPNAEELKNAIGNMLKAINFSHNQQEILSALSANMKFLAQYFSPNKALSEDLYALAARFANPDAPEYFEQLKGEALFLTKSVSDSLLNNERIQVLIPLIIHNLSRYNTNKEVLNEYFSQLLTQVSGFRMREELGDAFAKLTQNLFGGNIANESEQAGQTLNQNEFAPSDLPDKNTDSSQMPKEDIIANTANTDNAAKEETPAALRKESGLSSAPHASETSETQNKQSGFTRYIADILSDESFLSNFKVDEDKLTAMVRGFLLGRENGTEAIKNILTTLFASPEMSETEIRAALGGEMAQLDDITKLVDYLNDILRSMPDIPERQILYEYLTDIINGMVDKGELFAPEEELREQPNNQSGLNKEVPEAAKESTMKQLIEFVEKNIDHAAIKTLNNYNASNLLQSLINAPGVFTPLAHFIIPLDVGGLKSFGELWVDSDEENSAARASGGKCKYHLFLTFSVDAAGHFEVDLYADGKDVSLAFFYPESFAEKSGSLLEKVGRIIAQAGYSTREIRTGPLLKPHDLTQIFPNILERRTGFNVKA